MTDAEKMRKAAALLSCPFCGGTDLYFPHGTDPAIIKCGGKDGCGAQSGIPDEQSEAAAVAAWNRRALPIPVDASATAAGCQQAGLVTVDGRLGAVEVCGICDIAGCYHIRERQAPVRQCTDQNPIKNFPPGLLMVEVMAALEACVASLERADTQEGVCCCGHSMDRHSDPMSCGHSPVDMGDYYAGKAMDAARAALAKIRDVKC